MLWLSEILIQNEIDTFDELKGLVEQGAKDGEMFFRMDVKPPFGDTPEDWEDLLEASFSGVKR